jgi:hypothetical protein
VRASAHEAPALTAQKRRHLVSAYATVRHLLRQLQEAGDEGRSPSGIGAPLTPVRPGLTEAVAAPLLALAKRLRAAAAELAPDELAAYETPQPPRNTLNWMSNLLDGIRAAADNLQPRRMSKYGVVGAEEAAALTALHEELAALVKAARSALDQEVGGA